MFYSRGIREGCSLSPVLYLVADEVMVKEATYNSQFGVSWTTSL